MCFFISFIILAIFAQKKTDSVKISKVVDALERFAPLPLQEGYDNAGLQVGLTEVEVSGALLCLDVNEQIIDEAIEKGCNLVIAHHPLIFHKLSCVSNLDYVQRAVMKAIQNGITILAMHTNFDNAFGGVNFKIAEKLGLTDVEFLGEQHQFDDVSYASGIVGNLPNSLTSVEFIDLLKRTFSVKCVQCNQLLQRKINKVALCGGAGSFLLDDAINVGADAFVTGEMSYHEYFGHEQEIQIAVIGHYQSEQFTNEIFKSIIKRECEGVPCFLAETNTNPIVYM